MTVNAKHARFVEAYLIEPNATKAARAAGYSAKTARVQGSALLTNPAVKAEIRRRQDARALRVEVKQDRVVEELGGAAFSNIADVIEVAEDGSVKVRRLDQLPPHVQRTIESIKQVKSQHISPDGGEPLETVRLEVKLHPKVPALALLVKHLGMEAPQKHEHALDGVSFRELLELARLGGEK